jgi:hypothetical protein
MFRAHFAFCSVAVLGWITCAALCTHRDNGTDAAPVSSEAALRTFLQNYVKGRGLDDDKTTRYLAAFFDLNGDGQKEALVYLVGRWWCGSGGCPTLILKPERESYRLVAKISITRPPIRVLKGMSHGWRNIGVWVQGGGIQPGYEAELRFDGRTYPSNPSVAPSRRSGSRAEGETILPQVETGTPLYPPN